MTGTVEGGVAEVIVSDGTNSYVATINGTIWSVNLPLSAGLNNLTITAYPDDSDCDEVSIDRLIKYIPQ
jgi:hypothetical protein